MNIISYGLYLLQLMETTRTGQCFRSVQSPVVLGRGSARGHATILHRGLVGVIAPGLAMISKHSDVTWTHAQVRYLRDRALKRKTFFSFSFGCLSFGVLSGLIQCFDTRFRAFAQNRIGVRWRSPNWKALLLSNIGQEFLELNSVCFKRSVRLKQVYFYFEIELFALKNSEEISIFIERFNLDMFTFVQSCKDSNQHNCIYSLCLCKADKFEKSCMIYIWIEFDS